jgi:predicted aspartyl protease
MRDRYRWLSVLLSFVLTGQPFAMGYQEAEPQPAMADQAMTGTVSFDLYHGYLIVARGAAGPLKGLAFLLDTGASPTVLDPRVARKLHLEQLPASISVLGGSVQAQTAIVPSLSFGPMQRENVSVLIEDLSFLGKAVPVRIDGVIGLDVLGQGALAIDYASREIHFGPSRALPNSIPLRMKDGLAIVDAEVNDVPAHLLFDTGASSLILFARAMAGKVTDLKISTVQRPPDKIGEFERKQVSLHSLRLGKAEFGQEPAFVVPDGSHDARAFDGLMSPAALGITRVVIDVGRGKLAFSR